MMTQTPPRDAKFAAKLALAYGEILDGIRPALQRVSLRLSGDERGGTLELRNTHNNTTEIWQLDSLRLVPDQARTDALVLAHLGSGDARLILRDHDAIRALLTVCPSLPNLNTSTGSLPKLVGLGAAALTALTALLFILIPFMADSGTDLIPPEAEVEFGRASFLRLANVMELRECRSPEGDAALLQMQARLTEGLTLAYPLDLRVVDDPDVNAFALPGGQIVINAGLIDAAESPEEVAAVLAHEIGHVINRDGTRGMLRSIGSFGIVGLMFGDAVGTSAAAGVAQQMISASYSREAEIAADAFAHRQMQRAGLPPSALGDMFVRMQARGMGQEMGVFRSIASHPEFQDRIEAAMNADTGTATGAPVIAAARWQALQGICS
jgi:Zn-dependent protease with chaperone function